MTKDKQVRAQKAKELLASGSAAFRQGNHEEAQALFEEAAELDPRSAEAHAWLAAAYGRRIEDAWSLKDKVKLLSKLEHEVGIALEIDPKLPLARRMNGEMLLHTPDMLGGDPAAAAQEFQYCIARGMDQAEVWVSLAECYMHAEDWQQAEAAVREALAREAAHEEAAELLERIQNKKSST